MNTQQQNYQTWRLCVWSAPVMIIGYVVCWGWMAFNLPPFEPSMALDDLYQHYVDNNLRIKAGQALGLFFAGFYLPYSVMIARLMRVVEGDDGPLATVSYLGGALTVMIGLVCGACWLAAAYRIDERTPEIVRLMHDLGWIVFDATFVATFLQMLAAAMVFLSDKRSTPLIPRWVSWWTVFVLITFLPLLLLTFFYDGPFAWSGLFDYWIALGLWFVWIVVMFVYMLKAITRLEHDDAAAAVS